MKFITFCAWLHEKYGDTNDPFYVFFKGAGCDNDEQLFELMSKQDCGSHLTGAFCEKYLEYFAEGFGQ